MLRAQLFELIKKAAEVSGRTEFVVIGSQAAYGSSGEELGTIVRSPDADIYPSAGYTPFVYETLMLELGQDSDYHLDSGHYLALEQWSSER